MNSRKLGVLFVAIVFVLGVIVGAVAVQAQGGPQKIDPLPAGSAYQPSASESSLHDVYERVASSVVNISVVEAQGMGTGSGFVIDNEGHIVTNNHVAGSADYIEVTFRDGTVVEAKLVGADPDADLAVVQVDPSKIALQPLTFADSSQVFIGQEVMAIGSPFGQEQAFTVTTGIVSGLQRTLQNENQFSIPELIQTDAAINPGNSGGPLLDMQGNVVGVNVAILSGSNSASGVGFAIPANTVRRVVPYLIRDGEYQHSWLGIAGTTVVPAIRQAMNLPDNLDGVLVSDVNPEGPAAQAGIQGATQVTDTPFGQLPVNGDIITAINGVPVNQMNELIAYLEDNTLPGDQVTLSVLRNGQNQDVQVTLGARPRVRQ